MSSIVPAISIPDLDVAIRYYVDQLGFTVGWVHRRGNMGPATMAELVWESCSLIVTDSREASMNKENPERTVRIVSENCTELATMFRNVDSMKAVADSSADWTDSLVAVFHDPFGVAWQIFDEELWSRENGQPLRRKPSERISQGGTGQ